eukprot:scaffold27729_cov18-Prasinocladus_malaysianus.AAC.1
MYLTRQPNTRISSTMLAEDAFKGLKGLLWRAPLSKDRVTYVSSRMKDTLAANVRCEPPGYLPGNARLGVNV